jgi:hypothetical protein
MDEQDRGEKCELFMVLGPKHLYYRNVDDAMRKAEIYGCPVRQVFAIKKDDVYRIAGKVITVEIDSEEFTKIPEKDLRSHSTGEESKENKKTRKKKHNTK